MNNPVVHTRVSSVEGVTGPVVEQGPFKVLVVWESIPETTTLYLIEVTGPELELIKPAHCQYLGGSDSEPLGLQLLNFSFAKVTSEQLMASYTAPVEEAARAWLGRFSDCVVSPGPIQCDYWLQCGIMTGY